MSKDEGLTENPQNDDSGGSAPVAGSEDQKTEVLRQIAETIGTCETSFLCELLTSLQLYKKHPELYDEPSAREQAAAKRYAAEEVLRAMQGEIANGNCQKERDLRELTRVLRSEGDKWYVSCLLYRVRQRFQFDRVKGMIQSMVRVAGAEKATEMITDYYGQ